MNPAAASLVRSTMRRLLAVCVLGAGLLGCGGSQHPDTADADDDPEAEAQRLRDQEYERLRAAEPESPYEVRERHAFRPPGRCGQGPYRMQWEALGASYGEAMEVYACSPREISGDYRFSSEQSWVGSHERAYGDGQDNGRCVATASEIGRAGSSGGHGDAPAGAPAEGGGPAEAPAESEPLDLEEVTVEGLEPCPEGARRIFITGDMSYTGQGPSPVLDEGARFTVDLWSRVPNDLEGVLFVVVQSAVRDDMTPEAWTDYQARYEEWLHRYRAFLDRETEAGRMTNVDRTADAAGQPPPPREEVRPPRSSEHADWVPGYWHPGDAGWVWIAGFWRVPEADVRAELTVHAPSAPPPPRAEPEAQQTKPAQDAVWTPGHWQWDGRTWVWVSGAWRIPPSARHHWQPSRWRVQGRGSVFVPGGWTISVGN